MSALGFQLGDPCFMKKTKKTKNIKYKVMSFESNLLIVKSSSVKLQRILGSSTVR